MPRTTCRRPPAQSSAIGRPKSTASTTSGGEKLRSSASGLTPSAALIVENAMRSPTNAVIPKISASSNPAARR
ncbi:MAG: hypothetical protein R8F63_08760 [Acidimicrobiales bacterium]|nr:hypothetical protein [Acidimicrobiales bacterium]